jgi:hypothetical protein
VSRIIFSFQSNEGGRMVTSVVVWILLELNEKSLFASCFFVVRSLSMMCYIWAFLLVQLDLPAWEGLVSLLRNQVPQISLPFTNFIFAWGFSRSSRDQFWLQLPVFDFGLSTFTGLHLSFQHQVLTNPNYFSFAASSSASWILHQSFSCHRPGPDFAARFLQLIFFGPLTDPVS